MISFNTASNGTVSSLPPETMALVIAVIAGVAVLGAVLLAASALGGGQARLSGRMARHVGGTTVDSGGGAGGGPIASLKRSFFGAAGLVGQRLGEQDPAEAGKVRLQLIRAGMRSPSAPLYFLGAKAVLSVGFLGLFVAVHMLFPQALGGTLAPVIAVMCAAAGYVAPTIWLSRKEAQRKLAVGKELPDILDLLVVCVEAGMGLDQAISRVADESRVASPEMSGEFELLNLELRAGKSRAGALRNLAARVGLDDMDSLVTLLIQSDTFGTSMARTLRVYSDTFRTRRFQKAEEMAAKLPVKLLIPLVLFILPALFVVIIGPAALQLADGFTKF